LNQRIISIPHLEHQGYVPDTAEKIVLNDKKTFLEYLSLFRGKKVCVSITEWNPNGSNEQNRYYWGVIIQHFQGLLQEHEGEWIESQEIHDRLKTHFQKRFFEKKISYTNQKSEVITDIQIIGYSGLNTKEREEYHQAVRDLAFSQYEHQIPLPNENI